MRPRVITRGVLGQCLFVDPIADIAVPGPPDDFEMAEPFAKFTEPLEPLTIGLLPSKPWVEQDAWMLSLGGEWFHCIAHYHQDGALWTKDHAKVIAGGMSGSPIVSGDGCAIGVISCSDGNNGGPHPQLGSHLAGWLLHSVISKPVRARTSKEGERRLQRVRQRPVRIGPAARSSAQRGKGDS